MKQYITQFEALSNLKCGRQCRYWQKEKTDHAAVYVSKPMFCSVAVTSCCNLDHNYSTSEFKEGKEIHVLETKLENLSDVLWVSSSSFYKESQMLTKRPWFSESFKPTKICNTIVHYTEKF